MEIQFVCAVLETQVEMGSCWKVKKILLLPLCITPELYIVSTKLKLLWLSFKGWKLEEKLECRKPPLQSQWGNLPCLHLLTYLSMSVLWIHINKFRLKHHYHVISKLCLVYFFQLSYDTWSILLIILENISLETYSFRWMSVYNIWELFIFT